MLDLVDENDEVVGETTRKETDTDPTLIHREIGVVLVDDEKRILIAKRSWKKRSGPGMWTVTCGGHVEKGEKPGKAAYREVKEELGLEINLNFWEKELVRARTETHFTYRYIGRYAGEKVTCKEDEVETVKLADEREVDEIYGLGKMSPKSYEVMKRFWSRDFQRTRQAKER